MSESKLSPTAIAAFLAGAGLGVGTEIIIRPPPTDAGTQGAWVCTVMENREVLCKDPGVIDLPPDNLVVRVDSLDAGTQDAGTPPVGADAGSP